MEDIHDIKPLLIVDFPYVIFITIVIIVILLISLIAFQLYRYFKKPQQTKPAYSLQPSPGEIALIELNELEQAEFIQNNQSRIFYYKLSHIVRKFFQSHHKINASALTYHEFNKWIKNEHESLWSQFSFPEIFLNSMNAKFAKKSILTHDMESDLQIAKEIIYVDSVEKYLLTLKGFCKDFNLKTKLFKIIEITPDKRIKHIRKLVDNLQNEGASPELLEAITYLKTDYISNKFKRFVQN